MYNIYKREDVQKSSNRKLFTFADFFAGGGGSSTGLKLAGGKELWMNEFVEEACKTFSSNYPDVPIVHEDIKKLDGKYFLELAGIKQGEIDVISGSPPCSAFSLAGKREKGWNQTKKYSDGKTVENIEDLFFEYIRVLNEIRPKVVIAENVKGLTIGEAEKYLFKIINAFDKIGYEAAYQVMKACDYQVPQTRERCIFIAVRKDVADKLGYDFLNVSTIFPDKIKDPRVSLRDAIHDVVSNEEDLKDLYEYVQRTYQKNVIPNLRLNPERHVKPSDDECKSWNPTGKYFTMIRPCPDLPCPTLTQSGQQRSKSGVLHYGEHRKLTIEEMIRIMSLPEDYILTGKFDQRAERIGRMVCPIMMKHIGEAVYNKVIKPYKELEND